MAEEKDPVRAFLESEARRIEEALAKLGPLRSALSVKVEGRAALLTVSVVPGGARATSRLSPCERAVLAVLAKAASRMTGPEVLRALDAAGLRWSEVTVWRSLSRLHKAGYVGNSRCAPQGYWVIACPSLPGVV